MTPGTTDSDGQEKRKPAYTGRDDGARTGAGAEPTSSNIKEIEESSTGAANGVTRRVIGFTLVALGVLNSLFKSKAGIEETDWLTILLIGAGAIIFFSALRRGRGPYK